MTLIKNFSSLSTSISRKNILELIETALESVSPQKIMDNEFVLSGDNLKVRENNFDLSKIDRIFVIGFGKGSSGICKFIEKVLGDRLNLGWDIDVVDEKFEKIEYTKGTHPLPSQVNIDFTKKVLTQTQNLTDKDLVLVVICGGGSALFESPRTISFDALVATNDALVKSGATIHEINTVRKHLSAVKGGNLAKHLYPSTVVSLIFSDVPGNDLATIASGPTVKNTTTIDDVRDVLKKYAILAKINLKDSDFIDTPKEDKYFEKVKNIIMVSNVTALSAMEEKAKSFGKNIRILSDKFQGDAKKVGTDLISQTNPGEILLVGGETTIKVVGKGHGGRNQTVVLASLMDIDDKTIISSFGTDGWDFYGFAGAIGDKSTFEKAQKLNLDIKTFLDDDNSYEFFEKTGDGIDTGKLQSNVSDIIIVYKD